MPAVSEKQRSFMAICEHHPEIAKGKCPSKKVAHEFAQKPAGGYKSKHNSPPSYHKMMDLPCKSGWDGDK